VNLLLEKSALYPLCRGSAWLGSWCERYGEVTKIDSSRNRNQILVIPEVIKTKNAEQYLPLPEAETKDLLQPDQVNMDTSLRDLTLSSHPRHNLKVPLL
jgi:hypothetical protein